MMDKKTGTICDWREDKSFGFITPSAGGKEIFFHINDYIKKHRRPHSGMVVEYDLSNDRKGRLCAVKVCPTIGNKENTTMSKQRKIALTLFIMFSMVLAVLYILKRVPVFIPAIYASMSLLSILLFYKDKRAALKGHWRTPELTLLLISLIGGWPGALLAQSYLRHKSKKVSFRIMLWLAVFVNCGALYWFIT